MGTESRPASDWQELLRISQGSSLVIERVSIPEKAIAVEGSFTLPELARLNLEDQIFVTAFLRSHGSIKEMEQIFGVSYPTIKARLNRIAGLLQFIDTNPSPSRSDVLERLKSGYLTNPVTGSSGKWREKRRASKTAQTRIPLLTLG